MHILNILVKLTELWERDRGTKYGSPSGGINGKCLRWWICKFTWFNYCILYTYSIAVYPIIIYYYNVSKNEGLNTTSKPKGPGTAFKIGSWSLESQIQKSSCKRSLSEWVEWSQNSPHFIHALCSSLGDKGGWLRLIKTSNNRAHLGSHWRIWS